MRGTGMKLKDLVYVLDRDCDSLKIQVCKKDTWDEYDTIESSGPLIKMIGEKEIIAAQAIAEDVIRVDLIWDN